MNRYGHLFGDEKTLTVTLDKEELCALMQAYDWGIANASDEARYHLDKIMNKLAAEARG